MKPLCAILYAALCFATVSAVHVGPLKSVVTIGYVNHSEQGETPEEIHGANNLIGLLEYVRGMMPVGIADIFDIMEPYKVSEMPDVILDGLNGPLDGKVDLYNLVASGAQQYTIHSMGVAFEDRRVDYNLSVPEIVVDVDYVATDLVLYGVLKFNTSGHVHFTLSNLHVEGAFGVETEGSTRIGTYVPTGLEVVNYVDYVDVQQDITIHEDIVEQVKDALMTSVAKAAKNELYRILSKFSTKQVDEFLRG